MGKTRSKILRSHRRGRLGTRSRQAICGAGMAFMLLAACNIYAGGGTALSSEEQAILCVDLKSLLSIKEEIATLEDMSARLSRMQNTVAEVGRLIEVLPQASPDGPASAMTAPMPRQTQAENSIRPLWQILAASAALLSLIGFTWARRRRSPVAAPSAVPAELVPSAAFAPNDAAEATTLARAKSSAAAADADGPTTLKPPTESTFHEASPAPRGELPEIDEALELADVMVSMGLAQGAADTLTEHIRSNPRRALFHWLKLLDIYKTSGNQEDFEKSATELRQNFNIQAADWHTNEASVMRSIEDYGRLCRRLEELWRHPGCLDFLVDLLGDNRGGARQGFPQAVAEEILLLISILRDDETV